MSEPIYKMLENSSDAYVFFQVDTREIIYQNDLAKKHFILTSERSNPDFFERIEAQFDRKEITYFPDTPLRSTSDDIIYCDIEAAYLSDDKTFIWARITPKSTELTLKKVVEPTNNEVIFMEALPRLYQDVLFRLNPKTKVLQHIGDIFIQFGLPRQVDVFPDDLLDAKAVHSEDLDDFKAYAQEILQGKAASVTIRVKLIDDSFEWFSIESLPVRNYNGEVLEMIGKMTNVEMNKRLEQEASEDSLCHTLNRMACENLISKSLKEKECAVLLVDIDDFRYVNETHGHEFGDFLLAETGKRLNASVRSIDSVGRLEKDRFLVFLKNEDNIVNIEKKAKQILHVMTKPVSQRHTNHVPTVSIGIARYPSDGKDYKELYTHGEEACSYVKNNGKDAAMFYCQEFDHSQLVCVQEEEQRYHHALEMLDKSTSAFVVFHKVTHEVMSENKRARDLFYNESGQLDVNFTFGSHENVRTIIATLEEGLKVSNTMTISDTEVYHNNGKVHSYDLEFSYISDDRIYVYLKFVPKNDKKMVLLKTLMEKYKDPVLVVEKDEDLTISYANTLFYQDCGCTEDNFEDRYGSTLKDLFLPEKQELFMGIIWRTMRTKTSGYVKTPLQLANGELRWLYYDMFKMKMMDSDKKIYCQLMTQDTETPDEAT